MLLYYWLQCSGFKTYPTSMINYLTISVSNLNIVTKACGLPAAACFQSRVASHQHHESFPFIFAPSPVYLLLTHQLPITNPCCM